MKMTEKKKKYLVVSGCIVICAGLLVAISLQFGKAPAGKDKQRKENLSSAQVVVNPGALVPETIQESIEEKKVFIQPNKGTEAEDPETGRPQDSRQAQTDQKEQGIQPEVMKPEQPSEDVLTDPTTRPDGTKMETSPVPVEHEEEVTPTESVPAPGQPQAGDTDNGKIYIPGFGWVDNNGGGGSGTIADDMYENGNKIGSMD